MCKRHITQGMMKYRGSTRGAVMSERVVVRARIRVKIVDGPEDDGGLMALTLPLATDLERLSLGGGGCGEPARVWTMNQPASTYIGHRTYLMSGWRRMV